MMAITLLDAGSPEGRCLWLQPQFAEEPTDFKANESGKVSQQLLGDGFDLPQ